MIPRFRAKAKVRYAILFCLLSTLGIFAIARLAGWCCGVVMQSSRDPDNREAKSEKLNRRSFTARWHDSRELLSDLSETQKMANVRAKFLRHLAEKDTNDIVKSKEQGALKKGVQIETNDKEIAANIEDDIGGGAVLDAKRDLAAKSRSDQDHGGKYVENEYQMRSVERQRQIQARSSSLKGRKERDNIQIGALMDSVVSREKEYAERTQAEYHQQVSVQNHAEKEIRKVVDVKHDYDQNSLQKNQYENRAGDKTGTPKRENYQQKQEVRDRNTVEQTQPNDNVNYGKMRRSNRTVFDPGDSEVKYQILRGSDVVTRSLINQSRQADALEARDFPMTPDEAMARYRDRLPPWEQFEIFHYPKIYYLGLRATKTQLTSNETNNFGFDYDAGTEEEGRYRVVEGDHIGYRYEILRYLGAGTFGSVVLARDWSNPSARDVALKIMHYDEDLKYIIREMNINKYIEANASNIDYFPQMIATFQFRNHYCMVLELLGRSLDRHNIGIVRNMTTFRRYAHDILMGMQFMGELNVVHGDLKPENIMFLYGKDNDSEGQLLKVADFGISCIPGNKEFKCPVYYLQTRYYRAPEVILSLEIGPHVDMFSIGVIFSELYLGLPPFFGETETDQLAAMMEVLGLPPTFMVARSPRKKVYSKAMCYETENGFHRKPFRKPLTKVLRGMDPGLFDLIARCLEYDPKRRITPQQALQHPFLTGKYPPHGFPPPLSIQRLEGNA